MTVIDNDRQEFVEMRNRAIDNYRESSNLLVQFCNSTTDQLAIILVTAALAFLAIMTTSLGNLDLIKALSLLQKIIAIVCVSLFILSVILGIIALILEIRHLHATYIKHNAIVDELSQSKDWGDMQKVQDNKIRDLQAKDRNVGFSVIIHQTIFFILGILATLIYVGVLLFSN